MLALLGCSTVFSQSNKFESTIDSLMNDMPDVGENLYISVVVDEDPTISQDVISLLQNNLSRVVANNGFLDTDGASPFFLAMNYNVLSKDIVPGSPTRISQEIQFNFIIGDSKESKVFSSYSCAVRGIGINEQKSIIAAIRRIPWNDETFVSFIKQGKQGIADYYDERIPQIISEAQLLEKQGKYEQAIARLTTVPKACGQYRSCMRLALSTYQNMVDHTAYEWLSKSKKAWAASPNREGAERAIALADSIPSDSKYEGELMTFLAEIKNRLKEINDQEWLLKMETIKAENRAADRRFVGYDGRKKTVARTSNHIRSGQGLNKLSGSAGSSNFLSNLASKWNSQPKWKKVLIAGGAGLAATTVGAGFLTAKVAGALLARTSFHVVKLL